jgi:UDP:flavonoid glycosyltransferase YjiC (YdhE family)
LVVHDVSEWGALIAARLEDIPVVAHANGPMTARRVAEFREGLRAASAIMFRRQEPPKLLVDPCPAFLQHPAIRQLRRRISISPLESDWAGENDRRNRDVVYVTVGTGSPDHSPSILRAAVAAVHDLRLPLAVSLGPNMSRQRELIGWLRARAPAAELLEYVNHKHMLPRTKLIICHGGSQTLIHAARAATWVLALPSTSDQFHCARALARTEGGVWHYGNKAGATRLRKSIKTLLRLGEEGRYPFHLQAQVMRMPRPADAAEAVEREVWDGAPDSDPHGAGA